ncbi:MAG: TetR family transcriptional regulator [Mycobacterium sp.]|nr:TetR family transcriptional regulator [Mycobacterium sp.]
MSEPTTESESKLRQRTAGRLDRTRDPAILNAALAALNENGYQATNMNDIAVRAGVGKAADRFSDKTAVSTEAPAASPDSARLRFALLAHPYVDPNWTAVEAERLA